MTKKTAYSRSKYLTLVAVLAFEDDFEREQALRLLGELWGIAWRSEDERHPDRYIRYISKLAQYVVLYHRENKETP
jgi:hypothetical protein